MSPRILDEVKRSWQKRYWRDRFDERRAERALRLLDTLSESVDPSEPAPRIASHWQDDLVIAAAVKGNAEYLITGDKELRRVGEYQGVKIRTPQEFLEEFERAKPG